MFEETKEKLGLWAAEKVQREHDKKGLVRLFFAGFTGNIICWLIAFLPRGFLATL